MKKNSSCLSSNRKKRVFKDIPKYNTSRKRFKKKRYCLKCRKQFLSKGPYNRICEKCSLINERIASDTYSVSSESSIKPNLVEEQFYELN